MKLRLMLAAALAAFAAAPAAAQRGMIAPGMTPAQVRDVFGAPARTREAGDWSYWFYANGCPVRCGSDDVVFFQNDHVVTAVLRTHRRAVSGPAAPTALERAGGDVDADAIRARAADEGPAPRRSRPIHVRGRSRDAAAQPDESAAPARVGRIHVESGGRVIDRQTTGAVRDNPEPETGSTGIRAPATTGQGEPGGRGVRNPVGTAGDSVQGAPATAADDARAAREGEVRRNTLPNQPDTMQARRTNREKSVTPRVVPRP